jgi:hypothetical protein
MEKQLVLRFCGTANEFQGVLNFLKAYQHMTLKELAESKFLLV